MSRTVASRVVTTVGVLVLGAVGVGCGGAAERGAPGEDTVAATVLVCDSDRRQTSTVALAGGVPGADSPEEAVADGGLDTTPAGQVDLEDLGPGGDRVEGVVRDGGAVVAEVTVLRTPDGWFVESVTTCG